MTPQIATKWGVGFRFLLEGVKLNRGQIVIASIFGIALVAATFSLTYRYHQTHDVVLFWGPEAAQLIASPKRVELWKLEPCDSRGEEGLQGDRLAIDNRVYEAGEKRDVTHAPGFLNARSALTLNRSFKWDPQGCNPVWSHALVFSHGEETALIVLSMNCEWVYSPHSKKTASVASIAEGLAILFKEQLGS
jgi:hypothetical protein